MREIKKTNVKMYVEDENVTIITEKLNNSKNGSPRYQVMIFKDNEFLKAMNVSTYNLDNEIDYIIDLYELV